MTNHGGPGLEEPIESEVRSLSDGSPQLFVDVLLVNAETMKHADQISVLLLRVILSLVRAVSDSQLVEWCLVSGHLVG